MSSFSTILCCMCGTPIQPNPSAQCASCLASQFDLTSLLSKPSSGNTELRIMRCKRCLRYEGNGNRFVNCGIESPELMTLCLQSIPALSKNHGQVSDTQSGVKSLSLVDSSWVWTEPHSKRLKIRVTVKASLSLNDVAIQQRCLLTFVEGNKQCDDCNKEFTSRTWSAIVQIRERRLDDSKRNLTRLELGISSSKEIRRRVINIEISRNGFDFYFSTQSSAQTFTGFVNRLIPVRTKHTQKLVSTDNHSNSANIRHTFVCDVVPLEKDDLVLLSKQCPSGMGILRGRLGLVIKVGNNVKIIDVNCLRGKRVNECSVELGQESYFRNEKFYNVLLSANRSSRFVVIDVELCGGEEEEEEDHSVKKGPRLGLADVTVQRESDYCVNDNYLTCVTHLGYILEAGDEVEGYDLTATLADENYDEHLVKGFDMPDMVLIKKLKSGGASEPPAVVTDDSGGEKKKSRRQRKKDLVKDTKEKKGRGPRGAKTANKFESMLENMGFMTDERQRKLREEEDMEDVEGLVDNVDREMGEEGEEEGVGEGEGDIEAELDDLKIARDD
ncbi:hypothetical protein TL16_g08396 [Triparma laevis f. inornata]|uniref:60S ribosomal export protein NMD3 n=1 Tax=Triparma laevis f. inornata TaxID=1714386 RepID=A0A9W7AXY5_9STRA|nr:hypothetical protein TL16_g08396 [Triparma laevis f. inornata]